MPSKNHENHATPVQPPTATEVLKPFGLELKPALSATHVSRMRKALPGYVALLDDVALLLARDAGALNIQLTPAELAAMQARHRELSACEAVLQAALQSVYHQRLQLDSDAMGALLQLARRVQSRQEEAPELSVRWKVLLDFLGTFRTGGRPAAPIDETPPQS